jgi:hypothetical protein
MDQKAFLAVTAMINAFPQAAASNPDLTMATFEAALRGVTSQAVIEAAQRFTCGDVPGQSKTFAPSIAEFVQQARFVADVLPMRGRPALPAPGGDYVSNSRDTPEARIRMGFKMSVLSAGVAMGKVDMVAEANKRGLEDMIGLGQQWAVTIPEDLWSQVGSR